MGVLERADRRETILVVDDDEVVLDVTRAALENAGYVVVTRMRPEGTIAAILQEKPDLVLLDVNMPRMSGEMIASIASSAAPSRHTILLLYSSLAAPHLKLKVLQTGAHGYIEKTGSPQELVNRVDAWLKKGRRSMGDGPSSRRALTPIGKARVRRAETEIALSERLSSASAPPAPAMSGTLRLSLPKALFVDHDARVLADYEQLLRNEPIVPELTRSSEQALARISSPDPPDVVVSEVVLPSFGGIELFDRAIAQDVTWRQRFVFVTSNTEAESEYLKSRDARVLCKPIDMERLVRAVRYAALAARVFRDGKASER